MTEFNGNLNLLKIQKTGFLCSRKCPAAVIFESYDWAKKQRLEGNCIVCGNHSQIEKDVFEILLKGTQPLILVLARTMKTRWDKQILKALNENRLLIISPFINKENRITTKLAQQRNNYIFEICDEIYIPYHQPNGMLDKLIRENK